MRALKLHNTVFTREPTIWSFGLPYHCKAMQAAKDCLVAYWMKVMTRTLPVATFEHILNAMIYSLFCAQCCQGGSQKESLVFSHFCSTCPKFHHAKTANHNQVCKVLAASLYKHLAAHWSLYHEPQLSQTGLVLELIPTAIVLQSGRQVPDSDTAAM